MVKHLLFVVMMRLSFEEYQNVYYWHIHKVDYIGYKEGVIK
jgi:hypothetical protein